MRLDCFDTDTATPMCVYSHARVCVSRCGWAWLFVWYVYDWCVFAMLWHWRYVCQYIQFLPIQLALRRVHTQSVEGSDSVCILAIKCNPHCTYTQHRLPLCGSPHANWVDTRVGFESRSRCRFTLNENTQHNVFHFTADGFFVCGKRSRDRTLAWICIFSPRLTRHMHNVCICNMRQKWRQFRTQCVNIEKAGWQRRAHARTDVRQRWRFDQNWNWTAERRRSDVAAAKPTTTTHTKRTKTVTRPVSKHMLSRIMLVCLAPYAQPRYVRHMVHTAYTWLNVMRFKRHEQRSRAPAALKLLETPPLGSSRIWIIYRVRRVRAGACSRATACSPRMSNKAICDIRVIVCVCVRALAGHARTPDERWPDWSGEIMNETSREALGFWCRRLREARRCAHHTHVRETQRRTGLKARRQLMAVPTGNPKIIIYSDAKVSLTVSH